MQYACTSAVFSRIRVFYALPSKMESNSSKYTPSLLTRSLVLISRIERFQVKWYIHLPHVETNILN